MSVRNKLSGVLVGTGLVAVLGGGAVHATQPKEDFRLEDLASLQADTPARKVIGTFNDGSVDLGVVEMYSNGMFLTQTVRLTDDYSAEVLYFVRDGKTKESEWNVRCDLYKKGTPAAVNSMVAEGSIENDLLCGINSAVSIQAKPWCLAWFKMYKAVSLS
ncbi:MAG TPA: hypothetical protein VJJ52_07580 [Candidatus Nanoarchaeia archaeon]|nr:hypothetical protein [Candidatus Nanoarchaeia archaeon]